jgi:arsenite-transporting ATPase
VVKADSAEFVRNRLAMQDDHMQTVWEKFGGQVRAIVPLFDDEIRGTQSLRRLASAMYTKEAAAST